MLRLFLVAARLQGLPPQLPARELPNCMVLPPVALAADGCRNMHSSPAAWPASSNCPGACTVLRLKFTKATPGREVLAGLPCSSYSVGSSAALL
jgi:hypothetical protein